MAQPFATYSTSMASMSMSRPTPSMLAIPRSHESGHKYNNIPNRYLSGSPSTSWSPPSTVPPSSSVLYSNPVTGMSSSLSSVVPLSSSPHDTHYDTPQQHYQHQVQVHGVASVSMVGVPTSGDFHGSLPPSMSMSMSSSRGLFHCAVCDVCMTNEARDEHERGKKHARRVKKSAFAARNGTTGTSSLSSSSSMHHSSSSPSLSTQINDHRPVTSAAMAIPHGPHGRSLTSGSPVSSWSPSSMGTDDNGVVSGMTNVMNGMIENGVSGATPPPRKGFYFCSTCDIWMYSRDAEEHCSGKRHKKQVSLRFRGVPPSVSPVTSVTTNVAAATAAAVAMALAPPSAGHHINSSSVLSLASSHLSDGRQSNRSASSPALATMARSPTHQQQQQQHYHQQVYGGRSSYGYGHVTSHQSTVPSSSTASLFGISSTPSVSSSSRYGSPSPANGSPCTSPSPASSYVPSSHATSSTGTSWAFGRPAPMVIEHDVDIVPPKSVYPPLYDTQPAAQSSSTTPFNFSVFAGFSPLVVQPSAPAVQSSSSSSSQSTRSLYPPSTTSGRPSAGLWPRF